jgi:hypothetical protein
MCSVTVFQLQANLTNQKKFGIDKHSSFFFSSLSDEEKKSFKTLTPVQHG